MNWIPNYTLFTTLQHSSLSKVVIILLHTTNTFTHPRFFTPKAHLIVFNYFNDLSSLKKHTYQSIDYDMKLFTSF